MSVPPPPYDPFDLPPTSDGTSRFLLPFTPGQPDGFSGNQPAPSPAHSALISLSRIFESRRESLLKPSIVFGEFQLRRLVRRESGDYEARAGKRVRKQQVWRPEREGKFARLELAGQSGLLDSFFLGDDWLVARDDEIWESAVALVTESSPAPNGWVLMELSGLINRVLAARAGLDLGLNVDA